MRRQAVRPLKANDSREVARQPDALPYQLSNRCQLRLPRPFMPVGPSSGEAGDYACQAARAPSQRSASEALCRSRVTTFVAT